MANFEEQPEEHNDSKSSDATSSPEEKPSSATVTADPAPPATSEKQPPEGWTAEGLPVGPGVMGEPVNRRAEWDTGLCSCLGRNDDFWSSDLEVCVLGGVAPCVLYGSNVERIAPASGTFTAHCLPYTALYLIGDSCFHMNILAPWYSYHSRTAIRRKFNLEGSYETLTRIFGCTSGVLEDELKREQCESAFDIATHVICHPCAICQEGREVRRRITHPGYNAQAQPILVMLPPMEQTMGR
ncbi:PREDICTED: cell number regulator 8 [Ipomoea nil]|uniref:cell number regulator 8 n=1 Tax=Ipomoea nil TaxID=35883 RepID=UPI000900BAD1|nr:PREDICTED: cell number regulator 8 [Ipomoea nil]